MRPKLLGFLLLSLVAACHNDESGSSNPPPAIAPASPTQPRPTLVAAPVFDTVAPTVVNAYQVENESTVVVVFSEPMNSLVYFNRSMKSIIWSEDKTQLRATLQYKLDASSDNTEIQFNGLRDLNNNNLSTPFAFKFDQTNPHIEGVKILDNKNLQITFNETIVVQPDSKFIVNDLWQGTAVAEVRGQTLTLNFPEANFDSANSFSLKAMNFRDIYSNTESFQFIGLSKSDDTSPPLLKSYTLLARDKDIFGRRIAIHLEFDEYVVDTRDTKTGSLNSEGFDYSKDIRLNGKDASLTYWQPSADHKSANLLIHELSDEIKNRENNVIEFQLTDAMGNSNSVKIELLLDNQAPTLMKISKEGSSCEMVSAKSFRCRVSEDDTSVALLQPLSDWPTSSYKTKTSTEVRGEETFHWVYFETNEAMPEQEVTNVSLSDAFGNTSTQPFTYLIFEPITVVPEFQETIVSSTRFLEAIFSHAIDGIDEILVDGRPVDFSHVALDPYGFKSLKSVLVQFKSPLSLGSHTVEFKGVSRKGNTFVKLDSHKIEISVTKQPEILFASFLEDKLAAAQGEFRFEATELIKAEEFKVFAQISATESSLLPDIQFIYEGPTTRGTYQYKIKKQTVANLWKDINRQWLTFQIGEGKISQTAFVYWSSEQPRFTIKPKKTASQLDIKPSRGIDLSTLEIELVIGDNVTQVDKSWITPNPLDPETFLVTFPNSISLTEPNAILRIKSAVTTTFKIPLSRPFEILISKD